jgi:predicted PolB exonuclease-like 3'-5' exonuclease
MLNENQATMYWEAGENFSEYKWNNYTSRYHSRHTDLMDVLASYQNRAFAPLDEFSQILDLPGKIGLHGSEVYGAYLEGRIIDICNYCESDVLNTHLLYLRFMFIKGALTKKQYQTIHEHIEHYILTFPTKTHWKEFLPYLNKINSSIPNPIN